MSEDQSSLGPDGKLHDAVSPIYHIPAMSLPDQITRLLEVPDNRLTEITEQIVEDFRVGLGEWHHAVTMGPSFVTHIPDGTEKGTFLTLGLHLTTIRVSEVNLDGPKKVRQLHKLFDIPKHLTCGDAHDLFDFMAECVDAFLKENNLSGNASEALPIGLAFPFPVEKTSLNQAKLIAWTKGLKVKNGEGEDVVRLLQDAFDRKQVHVRCAALVNDTVAIWLSQCYKYGSCDLAVIFGAGTDAAYLEDIIKITKLNSNERGQMVVNTEWGAFNNRTVLPITPYDDEVDRESGNPGFHIFEKMISWMYIGEITRSLIMSLVNHSPPILFNGLSTAQLNAHGRFHALHMSLIEKANSLEDVKQVLVDSLGFESGAISDRDAEIVRWACEQVSTRAAKLSGCAIAAAIIQCGYAQPKVGFSGGEKRFRVVINGEMAMFYHQFETRLRQSLSAILGSDVERQVELLIDGDRWHKALGAALCMSALSKGNK